MTQPVDQTSTPLLVLGAQGRMEVGMHTNLGCVVGGAKDELGGSVVAGADVGDVGLVLHQDLGAAKVAKLEDTGVGIEKQVLRLDVAVADALRVDVGQSAEELVNVQLDLEDWHCRLHLVEETGRSVDRLRHKLLNQVQVHFVLLL